MNLRALTSDLFLPALAGCRRIFLLHTAFLSECVTGSSCGGAHTRDLGRCAEHARAQDAVRGDHGEVVQLLQRMGGRIYKSSEKRLVELSKSQVAGCARRRARLHCPPPASNYGCHSKTDVHCPRQGAPATGGRSCRHTLWLEIAEQLAVQNAGPTDAPLETD